MLDPRLRMLDAAKTLCLDSISDAISNKYTNINY